jgi:hypothetical protein
MRALSLPKYLVVLLAALALGGCDSTSSDNGSGHVSLLLTDAPGDVLAAVVTISAVRLQGNDGSITLLDTPYTTDLLELAGTTALLADDVEVENGDYREIRFVISGGYIEVDNGNGSSSFYASSPDYPALPLGVSSPGVLRMPSFGTSGLKVKLPGNVLVVDDDDHVIVVDFDASQSFGHAAGNSGQWVMHPVIRATVQ